MNDPDIGRIIVDEATLQARVAELAAKITADYAADPPLLVGVLKGAFMFMADLARAIDLPVDVDFMAVSSYGSATRTSGVVRIVKDLDADLSGRHVLIVEDIVDSGLTLAYLRKNLLARGPASLAVCALVLKEGLQRTDPDLRYVGFTLPLVRHRLRPRRGRALPQPALHRRVRRSPGGMIVSEAPDTAIDLDRIEAAVREILIAIGDDPDRDGLLSTPRRVAEMYAEVFGGLREDPARHLVTTFEADHDEMVLVRDIPIYSLCEHHLVPFHGRAHVAYIPGVDGRITGLSKLARLVDGFAKRPQVQERLTTQVADAMVEALEPRGVLVLVEAEHMCMSMRGVRKPGAFTVTSAVRGIFKENAATRAEVMSLLGPRTA